MSPNLVKCIVIGDSIIDTANLIMQRLAGQFRSGNKDMEGCEFGVVKLVLGQELVVLRVSDLKITDQFSHSWRFHCEGANCALLVFDASQYEYIYSRVPELITEIRERVGLIPILLLGCGGELVDHREVSQKEIEWFIRQWPNVFYQELTLPNQNLTAVLAPAALLGLNHLEVSIENIENNANEVTSIIGKLKEPEQNKRKQLEQLIDTVEEMGLSVNQGNTIELSTPRGVFSIDIIQEKVHFKPMGCASCKRFGCMTRYNASSNTLCIISDGQGWSNVGIRDNYLLVLSEIIAIQEDKLPPHVLSQIKRICPGYCAATASGYPKARGILVRSGDIVQRAGPVKDCQITPVEARALLRRYATQFKMGQLPYLVYTSLKERYEKILMSL